MKMKKKYNSTIAKILAVINIFILAGWAFILGSAIYDNTPPTKLEYVIAIILIMVYVIKEVFSYLFFDN